MAAWFRKNRPGSATVTGASGDDDSTGEIPVVDIARIVAKVDSMAERDKLAEGTTEEGDASKPDVEPVSAAAVEPADLDTALADRQKLVQLCLYALDRARSGGVAERIEQGLTDIGVVALRPDGQRFDPAVHEAGGAVLTEDSSLEGTVAETEVVGFRDHDRVLRVPVVTVYTRRSS